MVPATLSPSAVRAATRGMEPWVERRSFPPPSLAASWVSLPALESFLELAMLPIEDVPDHRPEGDAHLHRSLDQPKGYLGLGAKPWVRLAALEMVRGGVGLDLQRIVQSLVNPQARNGHDAVVYLADAAQVLLPDVRRGFPVFSVPGFVYYQRAACLRSGPLIFEHNLHSAPVHPLSRPARLGEEPLKTLCLFALRSQKGFGVGKGGQGLVSLGGQQQSFEVAAESLSLS